MFKHLPKLAIGFSTLAAAQLISIAIAPSASAFSISGSSIGIGTNDIGKEFRVFLNGNVDGTASSALKSNAIFKFLGFTTVGTGANTKTEAAFDITVKNNTTLTSSTGDFFQSRVSVLGFDVKTFNGTTVGSQLGLLGVGSAGGSGNTRATGIFTKDASGNMANAGQKQVCFSQGNCAGGASGGVGNTSGIAGSSDQAGKFTATLAMSGNVSSFALNNFGVRYQSIDGKLGSSTVTGASGTGSTTTIMVYDPNGPKKIPEPTTTAALGLVALSALGSRKRKAVAQA